MMKDLIRLRRQCDQYLITQSQLKSIGLQIATLQTQVEINAALKGASSTMANVNDSMNIKEIQQIMKQFARNSEAMGMKMDMVNCYLIVDSRCNGGCCR